jgi:hypothetical protein
MLGITRASVEFNGTTVTDFKAVHEKAVIANKRVNLMYKSASAPLTQRYDLELDYVVPQDGAIDWFSLASQSGTITIEYDGGDRHDFGGVTIVDIGDAAIDGENELVRKITFLATSRDGATGA